MARDNTPTSKNMAERLKELQRYGEQKAREAGITSEEQVNQLIYEQRHKDKQGSDQGA